MRATRHRRAVGPLGCVVFAGLVGGYRLARAARWAYSDTRHAWAVLVGGTLVT